jgi:valyl-tRNA synthetase
MDTTTATPPTSMPPAYVPADVEARWIDRWETLEAFRADLDPSRPPFAIVLPPPNVTGSLHLGHATNGTIQDVLCRARRMQGYAVLWQGGTDHAGIATQNVVERKLRQEKGLTRHDLGREAFLQEVWAWKEHYGNTILGQFKRLGASLDVSRWRFTMDEAYSRAVRKAFVALHEQGHIYRGKRIINWCPRCLTSLSDLEVNHVETEGTLYHVRYPLADGTGDLTVATVRPETILGDVAVAVNPADERFQGMVGKHVRVPMTDRTVTVIADEAVEVGFGTGALKVTPAHDATDAEIGQRHGLEVLEVIAADGLMNEAAGPGWAGLERFEARNRARQELEGLDLLVKCEPYRHNVSQCDRCQTVVEPRLSEQWFVSMQQLAGKAIRASEEKRVRFHPERWESVYLDWLHNLRDWCVSRQLWWGHRIPVWTCEDGHVHASETDLDTCPTCGKATIQDPDVLDTWFSSAMWPFATLGWPDRTPELERFYPTAVLSTARDILYLWVARMVFMGEHFVGQEPFRDVVIHATILDAKGQRMSKSKGTGVDPLDIMEKYGTDACRFWFAGAGTSGQDVRYVEDKLEAGRNFANKLWNASRFVLLNLPSDPGELPSDLETIDRWILSRLEATRETVTQAIDGYHLAEATQALYHFTWNEFCDWYIEMAKPRMQAGDPSVRAVLREVLYGVLRLLHPFMPFLTEEIHAQLVQQGLVPVRETLLHAGWPQAHPERVDARATAEVELLMDIVRTVRNMRAELGVPAGKKAERLVIQAAGAAAGLLEGVKELVATLTRSEQVDVVPGPVDLALAASGVVGDCQLWLPLAGLLDREKELKRLQKELEGLDKEAIRLTGQLSNEAFLAKAPDAVVAKLRSRQDELGHQRAVLEGQVKRWS